MLLAVTLTHILGQSAVPGDVLANTQVTPGPLIFNCFESSHNLLLLSADRLAFLDLDMFVCVADTFAFVRLRFTERANSRSGLADELLVSTFDSDFGVIVDRDRYAFRNSELNRMRITKAHSKLFTTYLGAETDADNL